MIDISSEELISLTEAANRLPKRRQGKRTAASTLYRWATVGLRGVQLETLPCGGMLCTSMNALQRFFDRLAEARRVHSSPPSTGQVPVRSRTHAQAQHAGRKAGEKLARHGA
jgi:hypothetical protein